MKRVLKKSLICILSVMLCMTMFPAYAFAEEGGTLGETADVIEAEIPEEVYSYEGSADNDELFAKYAESILYGETGSAAPLLKSRRVIPEGLNGLLYSRLKEEVALVADGTNDYTVFQITLADLGLEGRTWTAAELGVDAVVVNGAINQGAVKALQAYLGVDLGIILDALLADCPYELYWFDKTAGYGIAGPSIGASHNGSEYVLRLSGKYTISMSVAEGYSAGKNLVDTSKIERVHYAVDKATEIVAGASGVNDYNKLINYKDAICGFVTYDYNAAYDDSTPYGDPWQLISVFDDDANTNVVCEGYSKAFQYLCDRTSFDGDINCISVSGGMDGGTGAGAHMWNIVTMEDGLNYLVDVTNCDAGSVGAPDKLFLVGADSGSADAGYTFYANGSAIHYYYGEETLSLYDEELIIAESDYVYHEWSDWTAEAEPTCTETGLEKRTCGICGEEQTRVVDALGHDYQIADDTAVAATCTEAGHEEDQICSRCGDILKGAEIAAPGHDLMRVKAKEATETEAGNIEYWVCSECGKYFADGEGVTEISTEEVVIPMVVPVVIASDICGNDVRYTLYSDGEMVISGNGDMNYWSNDSIVPWYNIRESIITVTIYSGVTSIGNYAFYNCNNITSINIPESITSIGIGSFYNCNSLSNIQLPKGLISLYDGAFEGCSKLESIVIPDNINYIGDGLFESCSSLKNIIIPESVVYIGAAAFSGCSSLESIIIPDGVRKIDSHAFSYCSNLKHITIPSGITSIEGYMFRGCSSLKNIFIPNDITNIGSWAFAGCSNLDSIDIPDSLSSVGENAFYNCKNLKTINISNLSNYFNIQFENTYSSPTNNGAKIFVNGKHIDYLLIPDNVETISDNALCGCDIKGVVLAESVIKIGKNAFYYCDNLESIIIPESVTTIENGAFSIRTPNYTFYLVKDSYADYHFASNTNKKYVYKSAEHYCYNTIITQPTCVQPGLNEIICVVCGEIRTEEIPALGHDLQHYEGKAPTCTEPGWNEYDACSRCDYTTHEEIAALGHDLQHHDGKAATCTESGWKEYDTCSRCDHTTYEDIAALGHDYVDVITKATVTKDGSINSICSRCGSEDPESEPTIIPHPSTFKLSAASYTYSGGAKKPTVTVTDANGKTIASSNYSITYSNNVNAGTATAKVTFKGDKYSGSKSLTFKITAKKITPTVTLSATSYTYNGSVRKPTVTVKDGSTKLTTSDYTVTYASGRKNVGSYKVTVKLKGNYSGSKVVTFKINPKGTTLKTLTATSKGFKATWTKQATKMSTSYITGYQIQYSTSSTFASGNTTVTVSKYSTVSKTISKLKAKKKYYVRIRTYKTVSGTKYYSPWSAKKTVTTKA